MLPMAKYTRCGTVLFSGGEKMAAKLGNFCRFAKFLAKWGKSDTCDPEPAGWPKILAKVNLTAKKAPGAV